MDSPRVRRVRSSSSQGVRTFGRSARSPRRRVRFAQIGTEERGRLPALVEQTLADLKARAPMGAVVQ